MIDSNEISSERLIEMRTMKRQAQKLHDISRKAGNSMKKQENKHRTGSKIRTYKDIIHQNLHGKHNFSEDSQRNNLILGIVESEKTNISIKAKYELEVASEYTPGLINLTSNDQGLNFIEFDEAFEKLIELIEYYKFHIEVPRMHAKYVGAKVLKYHHCKRNIFYNKICVRLEQEAGSR